MDKALFAMKCMWKSMVQRSDCPYCHSPETVGLGRKHYVMQLRKCCACQLRFRFPTDDLKENVYFYQERYHQSTVTDLPFEAELSNHIENKFKNVGRDLTEHLKTIQLIAPTGNLLDYGCSWGYCVYQFREAGYAARGFEISKPRVEYGKSALGLRLTNDVSSLPDRSFDVIYSAHCLEHIPNPDIPIKDFQRLLKPGGHLFLYVPNCAGVEAEKAGVGWGPMIGEKHVLALTASFFDFNLPKYGFRLKFASSPYDIEPKEYAKAILGGDELLVIGTRT